MDIVIWIMRTISNIIKELFYRLIEYFLCKLYRKEYPFLFISVFIIQMLLTLTYIDSLEYYLIFPDEKPFISFIFSLIISGFAVLLLFYSFFDIRRIRHIYTKQYYTLMFFWSIYLFFETAFFVPINIKLLNLIPMDELFFSVIIYFPFFLLVYYGVRYIMEHYLTNWIRYSFFFILGLPFPSGIIAALFSELLHNFYKINDTNTLTNYFIVFGMIFLLNFVIYHAPEEKLSHSKVAIYLTLAVFSTISFCSFLLVDSLSNFIIEDQQLTKTDEIFLTVKTQAQTFFNYTCMPYLIGTFFGCFMIEYKEMKFKEQKELIECKNISSN